MQQKSNMASQCSNRLNSKNTEIMHTLELVLESTLDADKLSVTFKMQYKYLLLLSKLYQQSHQ